MTSAAEAKTVTGQLQAIRDLAKNDDIAAAQGAAHALVQQRPIAGSLLLRLAAILGNPANSDDPLQSPEGLAELSVPSAQDVSSASGGLDAMMPLHRLERAAWRSGRALDLQCAILPLWSHLENLDEGAKPQRAGKICGLIAGALSRHSAPIATANWTLFAARRIERSIPLWIAAARSNAQAAKWEECFKAAKKAFDLSKDNRVAASYLSLADLALGRRDEASSRLKKFGLHHGLEFLSLLTLELVRADEDTPRQPPGAAEPATVKIPAKPDQSAGKAKALLINEQYDEALALMDEAAAEEAAANEVESEAVEAAAEWLYLRGYALFHLKRPAEAYSCFATAIEPQPTEQMLLSGLGQTARQFGQPAEALSYLLEILPVGPDDFGAFFYAGLCYDTLGERELALKALNEGYARFFYDNLELNFRPLYERVLGGTTAAEQKAA